MQAALRRALAFLLCALMLGAGLPARALPRCGPAGSAGAATGPAGRPCCAQGKCCCNKPVAMTGCACKGKAPSPLPPPPSPRQPLRHAAEEPLPLPKWAALPEPEAQEPARARPAARAQTPLPHCTRQEALSVWRL